RRWTITLGNCARWEKWRLKLNGMAVTCVTCAGAACPYRARIERPWPFAIAKFSGEQVSNGNEARVALHPSMDHHAGLPVRGRRGCKTRRPPEHDAGRMRRPRS